MRKKSHRRHRADFPQLFIGRRIALDVSMQTHSFLGDFKMKSRCEHSTQYPRARSQPALAAGERV